MPRRLTALLLLLPLAFAACGGSDSGDSKAPSGAAATAPDLSKVTLRIAQVGKSLSPIIEYAGETDTPYKVEWSSFDAAPPVIQAIQADAADLGISSDLGVLGAVANGSKIKAVAATEVPGSGMQVLVPADSPIKTVADLRGKKVGVFKGSAGEGFFVNALKTANLTEKDLKVINLTPPQGAAAFNSGQIDAWAIWEPMASSTVVSSKARRLIDGSAFWKTRSFIDTSPTALADPAKAAAIGDFLERFARATKHLAADQSGWAAKYAEVNKIPANVAELASPALQMELLPLDAATTAKFDESLALYRDAGLITKDVSSSALFVPDFTEQIERGRQAAR